MNRGCKVESYSNMYFPNTSLTKPCQPWMITKKTECLPWIIAIIIPYVSQFFLEIPKIVEITVFAGHPSTSCNT